MANQPTPSDKQIESAYALARERYALLGVDTDKALERLSSIAISLHCWQGDDVGGFEAPGGELGGGLAATGNYPGKARTADELRQDLDTTYSLIPGKHRLNLHAIYAETGGKPVERTQLQPEHFSRWVDWAKANGHGLDFNPTCFSHPLAASGFTLASYDQGIRHFWIEHCIACRKIGESFGRALGTPCVTNVWIPDGLKDTPVDRKTPRELLKRSLDAIFAEKIDPRVQSGRGRGQALRPGLRGLRGGLARVLPGLCHHPGRAAVAGQRPFPPHGDDRGQAVGGVDVRRRGAAARQPRRALGQRPRRDPVRRAAGDHAGARARRLPGPCTHRPGLFRRQHQPGGRLDHGHAQRAAGAADGAVGADRSMRALEVAGDYTSRLALLEELKGLPFGAVWDYHCLKQHVPVGMAFMDEVKIYEADVLWKRG